MKLKLYSLILLLLTLVALPAFAGTPIDKTVSAKPDGDVYISNVSGSVEIATWKRNEIHVGGILGTGSTRLAVEKTDGGINIRVVLPNRSDRNIEASRLTIQLPAASHLRVNTVSANITANGLTGPFKLESVSGEIKVTSKSADIGAKSVSGDIDITGSAPHARIGAHSISGEIEVKGIRGELRAETVSGDIEADGSNTISRAKLETTSGEIEFAGALASDGDYEFHSVSGDVKLKLPKIPAGRFNVTSFSGDINANFGPKPQRTSEYGPGKEWHFRNGTGEARININTMSGDIQIHAPHP